MPRYLAVNFVQEAEKHHRSILNDLLLTVPEHLEHVESYPHKGKVYDTAYRRPWVKARGKTLPVDTDEPIKICSQTDKGIEKFENEDDLEVIPSSNPLSQKETTEDEPHDGDTNPFYEVFYPEDLSKYRSPKESLEEPLCDEFLYHCKKQLPAITALLSRLRTQHVIDPFTTENGQLLSETDVMGADRKFSDVETEQCGKQVSEEFKPEPIHRIDEIELEEKLEYPLTKNSLADSELKCDVTELMDTLKLAPQSMEDEGKDPREMIRQLLDDLVEELPDKVDRNCVLEKIEEASDTRKDQGQIFKELNDLGVSGESTSYKNMILESPVTLPLLKSNPVDLSISTKDALQLRTIDERDEFDMTLVNSHERNSLEKQIWSNEKYFTDVSVLRLPEVNSKFEISEKDDAIIQAKKAMNVKAEGQFGSLELKMSWDPLKDGLESALQMSKQMLRYDRPEEKEPYSVEIFRKIDLSRLKGSKDSEKSLMVRSRFEKTRKMVEKKAKGIPRYSAEKQLKHIERSETMEQANRVISARSSSDRKEPNNISAPLDSNKKEKAYQSASASMVFSDDPLDNFMRMRNSMKRQPTPSAMVGSTKRHKPLRELSRNDEAITSTTVNTKGNSQLKMNHSKEAPKPRTENRQSTSTLDKSELSDEKTPDIKTVKVPLSDSYLKLLNAIEEGARPLLKEVQKNKILPATQTLPSLTPDITRFLTRQYEHNQKPNCETDMLYCTLLGLHAQVTSRHLLVNYCLPSAMQALTIMCDRYPPLKEFESLPTVYEKLFSEQSQEHPKVKFLLEHVTSLVEKRKNDLVLIVCNKDLPAVLDRIEDRLNRLKDVRLLPVRSLDVLLEQLENTSCNCVLTLSKILKEEFPLDVFHHVIEYDPVSEPTVSKTRELCRARGVNYVGLHAVSPENIETTLTFSPVSEKMDSHESTDYNMPSKHSTESESTNHILLGSTLVTGNADLLHSLESRQSIQILERDYVDLTGKENCLQFADIDVDCQTGITLQSLSLLQTTSDVQSLVIKLAALSSKYTFCWLVLYHSRKDNRYSFGKSTVTNLAKLYSSVPHLCSDVFKVQIVLCENEDKVAMQVKCIVHDAQIAAEQVGNMKWLDRDFLQYHMSKHEQFLLTFSCLNAFSAQTLLSELTLVELMAAPVEKLKLLYPFLPIRTIQTFCELKKENGHVSSDHEESQQIDAHGQRSDGISVSGDNRRYSVNSADGQPDQDFKLKINEGVRGDGTSEHDWSSSGYEEQEVPDIEAQDSRETFNEYEMAEIEGSINITGDHCDRRGGTCFDEGLRESNLGKLQRDDNVGNEYHLASVDGQRMTANFGKTNQFQHPIARHIEIPNTHIKGPYDINGSSGHCYVEASLNTQQYPPSTLISREEVPSSRNQSAYNPGFLDNISSASSQAPKSMRRSGFWTDFSDTLRPANQTDNDHDDKFTDSRFRETHYESRNMIRRTSAQEPMRRRHFMEMMNETPRMHQPYSRPHHRIGQQSSVWQMPPRLPSIAAVTPSQRNPMPTPSQRNLVPVNEFLRVGRQSPHRNISASSTGERLDSPPMDPDSDEECLPFRWQNRPMFSRDRSDYQRGLENKRHTTRNNIPGPLLAGAAQYRKYLEECNEAELAKKRKLTYERVPGMKGGQTRLSFM